MGILSLEEPFNVLILQHYGLAVINIVSAVLIAIVCSAVNSINPIYPVYFGDSKWIDCVNWEHEPDNLADFNKRVRQFCADTLSTGVMYMSEPVYIDLEICLELLAIS